MRHRQDKGPESLHPISESLNPEEAYVHRQPCRHASCISSVPWKRCMTSVRDRHNKITSQQFHPVYEALKIR